VIDLLTMGSLFPCHGSLLHTTLLNFKLKSCLWLQRLSRHRSPSRQSVFKKMYRCRYGRFGRWLDRNARVRVPRRCDVFDFALLERESAYGSLSYEG